MNGKVTDAAVEAAINAYEKLSEWGDSLGNDAERECMRAALEAALPHLQPSKPESGRLRYELGERAEFEAWADSGGFDITKFKGIYNALATRSAWEGWHYLSATGKQQVGEDWSHIANEWADAATNGVQWLRNIRDGASTVTDALACMESNVARIQQMKPQQVGEVQWDALWWLQDAINTMAEGGNETHTEKLQALHDALAARQQEGQYPEYIRDVHDVEQGLIRNPKYVATESAGEVQGDRARFEAWAATKNYDLHRAFGSTHFADGEYTGDLTPDAWAAWQEALATRKPVKAPLLTLDSGVQLPLIRDEDGYRIDPVIGQPVGQEPVGTTFLCPGKNNDKTQCNFMRKDVPEGTLLYAAPPAQAVDLGPCNCHPETCCCDAQRRRSP